MATKFEQLCAAFQSSRDGFAAYRTECTAFLLRVGHQLEATWGIPSLRLAVPPAKLEHPTAAATSAKTTTSATPAKAAADPTDAAFDTATGLFRLEMSFDVQGGHDAKAANATRSVTIPLAARKEGNGFMLSIDGGEPKNVGTGTETEVAPLLDEAFARVMARFEQDPRRVRDLG